MKYPQLLKTKEEAIEFLTWIGALQSGFFQQTIGQLEDNNNRYCYYGVGCVLFIPEENLRLREIPHCDYKRLNGALPMYQEQAPQWLKNLEENFSRRANESIAVMNDIGDSFEEIASRLLREYEDELNALLVS